MIRDQGALEDRVAIPEENCLFAIRASGQHWGKLDSNFYSNWNGVNDLLVDLISHLVWLKEELGDVLSYIYSIF